MDEPSCSSTSQTECIIHNKSCNIEKNEKLTTPQSLNSWKTLLEAATTRNHIHLLSIAAKTNEGEVPNISYHTKCRNLFTLKRDLQNIKQKMEQDPRQSPSEMPSKHHKRVIPPKNRRVYQKVCIFCEKEKRQKDQSREKLVLTTQLRVDKSLRRCATIRGDEKILAITARDIVAAEAHYHRSCYRTYTWQTPKVKKVDSDKDDYAEIEKEAMKELYNFIRSTIIPLKQIVPLTYIAKKLEEIMNNKGVVQIKESSKTHIRRKLDDNMSTSLILISDDDGKVVVVPHTVTLEMVVKENRSLQKAIKLLNKNTKDNETILDQASTILRTTINQDKKIEPWPYHPSDLDISQFTVPKCVERFLLGILTGKPNNKEPSMRVSTLINSLTQDLIYGVTRGLQKPPKHFLLPYAVKTLTGNVEIINMLNRLGHGVSYSQLEENDTALCLKKLQTSSVEKITLSSNLIATELTYNSSYDKVLFLEGLMILAKLALP